MSSNGDDRDDANLKQFQARTNNAKIAEQGPAPIHLYVTFDGFDNRNNNNNQIDTCAWTHVGTSPSVTPRDASYARRRVQEYMNDL